MSPERADALDAFLRRAGWADARRAPLAGDASPRRYDRLDQDGRSAVLMDAPPHTGEDVRPFAALTDFLRAAGFSAPAIYDGDAEHGFLLLEDLGDALFARVMRDDPSRSATLYAAAVDLLAALHEIPPPEAARSARPAAEHRLRPYDAETHLAEAGLALAWWVPAATGADAPSDAADALDAIARTMLAATTADRAVLVLRDFHAENLVWLPGRAGVGRAGLLDYQDALAGHPAYDLASLVGDVRRAVSDDEAAAATDRFLAARGLRGDDADALRAAAAAQGALRLLKIIGIFARLHRRDGKSRYLDHQPLVWRALRRALAHPICGSLRAWTDAWIPEPTPSVLARIRAEGGRV